MEGNSKEGLHVLVCAFACDPKGTTGGEDVLGWSIVEQIARWHEAWVLTSEENRSNIERRLLECPLPGTHFCYMDLPWWLRRLSRFPGGIQCYAYLWQISCYWVALKLHRRYRFDLFHHVTYANDWMASFIGALLPLPYIRGPGGGAQRVPKPFLQEFSLISRSWEYLRSFGQWIFKHDPFFIVGQSRARAILVCNEEARRAIPEKWRDKVYLFPVNGINRKDLEFLGSPQKSKQKGIFRVLSAGKLLRLKGFTLAIKAFKIFVEKYPHAELEIVGDGADRRNIESLIQDLHIGTRVRLTKWVPRNDLLLKMANCDVFLFPSLRDGGGAVVIEAMAAGKPVICLDLGGPGLHVSETCGIKISPRSTCLAIHEIAAALGRLHEDQALRIRIGQAARKRAEETYHWDRLGERLSEIYGEALTGSFNCLTLEGDEPRHRSGPRKSLSVI